MSRNQSKRTDTLTGQTLIFSRETAQGIIENRVNVTTWQSWKSYLEDDTSGFYHEDTGVQFTPTYRTLKDGSRARYWNARKQHNGKLYTAYIGKSDKMTLKKIQEKARQVLSKAGIED